MPTDERVLLGGRGEGVGRYGKKGGGGGGMSDWTEMMVAA